MKAHMHPLTRYIMMSSFLISCLPKLNAFRSVAGTRSPTLCVGSHQFSSLHSLMTTLQRPSRSLMHMSSSTDSEAAVNNGEEIENSSDTWQNPRSRWARRKHRKKTEKLQREGRGDVVEEEDDSSGLNWDKFEFGDSPKMDKRFANDSDSTAKVGIPDEVLNAIPANSITFKSYVESEADLDKKTSESFKQSQSELLSLTPDLVQKCIDILSPYVQDRRMERIDEVLSQRTRHTRFLFENPSNPSNVWACLRTLDSFGIQYVDVIVNSDSYAGKAAVGQKKGMRTAMGSACWMTLRQFGSTEEAIKTLREEEGCLIYATDLNPESMDVRNLNWDSNVDSETSNGESKQRPICVVMGNEERGISNEMRELADGTFYLPMCGFAESFNLSVATAITLAHMSAVSNGGHTECDDVGKEVKGPLRPGDLDPHELQCLRLKGVINSLAQKRMGKALLKKEGIVLPSSLYN